MTKLISAGIITRVPIDSSNVNLGQGAPKSKKAKTKKINEMQRVVDMIDECAAIKNKENWYLLTKEVNESICKEMNINKSMLNRTLKRNMSSIQCYNLDNKQLHAVRMLDLENTYISKYFNYDNREIEIVYDNKSGYINVTQFSSQFEVTFRMWRREFNGNDALKWLNKKFTVNSRKTKNTNEEEEDIGIAYRVENCKYEFAIGDYVHPEIFQMYACFVHPVLGLIISRLLSSLKISRSSYLKCKYEINSSGCKRKACFSNETTPNESDASESENSSPKSKKIKLQRESKKNTEKVEAMESSQAAEAMESSQADEAMESSQAAETMESSQEALQPINESTKNEDQFDCLDPATSEEMEKSTSLDLGEKDMSLIDNLSNKLVISKERRKSEEQLACLDRREENNKKRNDPTKVKKTALSNVNLNLAPNKNNVNPKLKEKKEIIYEDTQPLIDTSNDDLKPSGTAKKCKRPLF